MRMPLPAGTTSGSEEFPGGSPRPVDGPARRWVGTTESDFVRPVVFDHCPGLGPPCPPSRSPWLCGRRRPAMLAPFREDAPTPTRPLPRYRKDRSSTNGPLSAHGPTRTYSARSVPADVRSGDRYHNSRSTFVVNADFGCESIKKKADGFDLWGELFRGYLCRGGKCRPRGSSREGNHGQRRGLRTASSARYPVLRAPIGDLAVVFHCCTSF